MITEDDMEQEIIAAGDLKPWHINHIIDVKASVHSAKMASDIHSGVLESFVLPYSSVDKVTFYLRGNPRPFYTREAITVWSQKPQAAPEGVSVDPVVGVDGFGSLVYREPGGLVYSKDSDGVKVAPRDPVVTRGTVQVSSEKLAQLNRSMARVAPDLRLVDRPVRRPGQQGNGQIKFGEPTLAQWLKLRTELIPLWTKLRDPEGVIWRISQATRQQNPILGESYIEYKLTSAEKPGDAWHMGQKDFQDWTVVS